jgi:hypothetical protein
MPLATGHCGILFPRLPLIYYNKFAAMAEKVGLKPEIFYTVLTLNGRTKRYQLSLFLGITIDDN